MRLSTQGGRIRTLIYKRTHPGDPDRHGRFGIEDCMGQVRTWDFGAVIGVGGIGAEPRFHGLDRKVNWIGIGPHRIGTARRGPVLTFDRFRLFESEGPSFSELAPRLAARIYSRNVRVVIDLDDEERREVERILALATDAGPSAIRGLDEAPPAEGCPPKRRQKSRNGSVKGCSR
jgi:hypothetical protein